MKKYCGNCGKLRTPYCDPCECEPPKCKMHVYTGQYVMPDVKMCPVCGAAMKVEDSRHNADGVYVRWRYCPECGLRNRKTGEYFIPG